MRDEHTDDRPQALEPRLRLERPGQTGDQPLLAEDRIDDGTGDGLVDDDEDRESVNDSVE